MSDNVVKRTGVIGLGAMGLQMARHMANEGFAVSGYDIDAAASERARSHGIKPCGSAAEVAREADVVVIMVATEQQVVDVASSLISALAPNTVVCVASSVSP